MRYEDVAQDGRVLVEALATSVNETLWRVALRGHPLDAGAFQKGTLAILSRFVVEGGEGPFSVDGPFEAECKFALARGENARGEVERIYMNAWVDTYAPIGRTNFPAPAGGGTRAVVGRSFVEHVFTRPFAPRDERKVTRLDIPGVAPIPVHRHESVSNESIVAVPAGATDIDADLVVDPRTVAFGLRHTDSNQHVNSLVYPQLFEEACLRRFRAHGLPTEVLARQLEIAYRKPCFAGQEVAMALRAFRVGDAVSVVGGFYDATDLARDGLTATKPHAYVRMGFAAPTR